MFSKQSCIENMDYNYHSFNKCSQQDIDVKLCIRDI